MKTKYLLLFLSLVFSNSLAQEFLPLLDTNKMWSTVDEYYYLLEMGPIISDHYYLKGDTVIDNDTYLKVYRIVDQYSTNSMYGFIREDTTHKVYFRNTNDEEGPLYDFNITIGDTIDIIIQGHKTDFKAVVKEFGVFNDLFQSRRTIVLQGVEMWTETETWIEGIGSINGLLESCVCLTPIVGSMIELLCFHENDSLKYLNPRFSDCSWPKYVGIEENERDDSKILIYPNPIVGTANFKIIEPISDIYFIEFYNSSGQLIYEKQLSFSRNFVFDKSHMGVGMIYYRVIAKDEVISGCFQIH